MPIMSNRELTQSVLTEGRTPETFDDVQTLM
jgi:hypothetical protein